MEEEPEGGDEKKEVQIQPCLYDDVMATSQVIRADFEATAPPRGLLSETCVRTEFSKLPRARRCVPPPREAICSPPPAPSAGLRARQPGWKALLLLACPGSPRPSCQQKAGEAGLAESGAVMVSAGGGFQATVAPWDTRAKNTGDSAFPARRLGGDRDTHGRGRHSAVGEGSAGRGSPE
ncbi:unnamed protein product [Coccothraustes coccothraustes]